MPSLRITEGPLAGSSLDAAAELVLGREGVDVVIDDPEISRRHAAFHVQGGEVEVEDLGSLNGTFVNGTRLEGRVRLAAGDVVTLGSTSIHVESDAAGVADAPRSVPTQVTPPPAPPPPPAAAPPAPAIAPPSEPFGGAAVGPSEPTRRRGRAASRRFAPTALSILAIVATAGALLLYFGLR